MGELATVWLAVVAAIGAFGTALLTYLSSRDRLRYDTEMAVMKKTMLSCETEREEARRELADHRERADESELRLAAMEGKLFSFEREAKEMHAEISELRDRLYGRPT